MKMKKIANLGIA